MSTWRLALVMIWSMNSRIFSCWRPVARTLSRPFSGLAMTEAASRKVVRRVTVVLSVVSVAGLGLPAKLAGAVLLRLLDDRAAVAPVPEVLWLPACSVVVSEEPSGRILSVSRRISLMFCSRVAQKRLLDLLVTEVVELLP